MNKQAKPGPQQPAKPKKPAKPKRQGPSRLATLWTSLKHNFILALLSAIVAFAGGMVWGARYVQDLLRAEQTDYDLTAKRIDLIERTVNLMGKSTAVIGQERSYTKSFLTAMAKTAEDPTKAVGIIAKMLKESSQARCDIAAAHAEFISLLALNEIFFGERTDAAVRALQRVDPWWEADSARKARLIAAMEADFYHKEATE